MARQKAAPKPPLYFGGWLVGLRAELNLPQWKVGAAIGVDAQTYGKFEAEIRWPNAERLEKLAQLLGRPLREMQARMALAKAMSDCGADLESIASVVEETQAAYGDVDNVSATRGKRGGNKK